MANGEKRFCPKCGRAADWVAFSIGELIKRETGVPIPPELTEGAAGPSGIEAICCSTERGGCGAMYTIKGSMHAAKGGEHEP